MRETMVYQEYSINNEYRFEVYSNPNYYEIWVQKKLLTNIWEKIGLVITIFQIICTMQIDLKEQLK